MNRILLEIAVIALLLVANGVFAMAEIAVVSSRKARLKKLADEGSARARQALALVQEPTRFLSTVQIGITLVGVLAGAFGGATLARELAVVVARVEALAPFSDAIGLFVVVGAITYFSVIFGELVPKRVALSNPEARAMLVARPMSLLSKLAGPVVGLLAVSTQGILKLFGLDKEVEPPPSEEEISNLIEQGTTAGVFHKAEREMVEGVLRLDERGVTEIMTRRNHIVWLDLNADDEINWRRIVASGHSYFPVFDGSRDRVAGMVSVKALWANAAIGLPNNLRDHLVKPFFVSESLTVVQLLETFKRSGRHFALVADEFGSVQGLVTLIDVMEAIVGDLPEPGDRREPQAVQRDDGSWLVDGAMEIRDLKRTFELAGTLPGEDEEDFHTLGGFVVSELERIPKTGEKFEYAGWRFEVVDMDRFRVDKVLMSRIAPTDVGLDVSGERMP
ncbi:hemolysin family protein [Opitutales bacterium ASA1]|uniref:hemolysin family protein n=1 Tax=Congregicoccus parvus TaxID=3081749 RepID=UPI002B2E5B0B|nr:hemolysin family protein [Opitutales bacterium ASA1]